MKDSKISWTHNTFNPWWGCVKVSAGCTHCYAETFSKRTGNKVWGADAERRFFGPKHWQEPLKWNREAMTAGERQRVFCGSMCDWTEIHQNATTNARMNIERAKLFDMIDRTPMLDWLLLTKRPENIVRHLPVDWLQNPRDNVWLGTTCENQEQAKRIPLLVRVPAAVRFLSCEPLLGPIDFLSPHIQYETWQVGESFHGPNRLQGIHWVIVGGESGHGARPMDEEWARDIKAQCLDTGVDFFMKQMGGAIDKRHDLEDMPEDLRIQQFPTPQFESA